VEALTQQTTAWPDETVVLPDSFPAQFANITRRCLSAAPAVRPTVLDIEAQFKPATPASAAPATPPPAAPAAPQPAAKQTPPPAPKVASPQGPRKPVPWGSIIAIGIVTLLALWAIAHFLGDGPKRVVQPPPTRRPAAAAPAVTAKSAETKLPAPVATPPPTTPTTSSDSPVLHEVTPDVPRSIQQKIRGRVHVTVRVLVDSQGNVVGAMMEKPGPSKYFARLAEQSANEWKFIPASKEGRVWLLLFVFTRDDVKARAIAQ
jgi:TonB family protein